VAIASRTGCKCRVTTSSLAFQLLSFEVINHNNKMTYAHLTKPSDLKIDTRRLAPILEFSQSIGLPHSCCADSLSPQGRIPIAEMQPVGVAGIALEAIQP